MKKTIIALAVAAATVATSANASVIYQKDGTKIDLDGRLHLELQNLKDERTTLRDTGSRVRFRAYQEIGGGFSALGAVELRFSNANEIGGNMRAHRLFAGFTNPDIGTLTFGRQLHLGDHIPKANYTYDWGGNIFFDAHKKAAHFMSARFNGFRVAADYYFGNATKDGNTSSGNSAWDEGQGYGVGLFYDGKWNDLAFRFGSGFSEVNQSTDGTKTTEYKLKRGGVGFDVKYQRVTVGFDWAFGKATKGYNSKNINFQKVASVPSGAYDGFNKNNRFLVGLKLDITEQNALYGQYYFGKAKRSDQHVNTFTGTSNDYKMRGWMVGVDHKFNKHVVVYLEGGTGKVKQGGEELVKNHRAVLGTRILF
ncbi:porin [Conservatibacter flavescens]|uniref:Porin n=1 Tax=Conservatibacter flavescens TaxID=28161 RepID=A0A2M8S0B3_9PAST|nr:porin [Conservatibacter flavescens]PJG84591.1 porin [Conservatibacter flavescens]